MSNKLHMRSMRKTHACPNCGAEISNAYEFCARNVFGVIREDRCRAEYESFWRRAVANQLTPAMPTPTYGLFML